ncbi:MAG: SDR family oxidoreductase [Polyangiaceae bacterium]
MRWVITGANRGIGLELVRQLVSRGEEVVAGARDPSASALEQLVLASGGRAKAFACDVSNDESVATFAQSIGSAPIDVLVNNAGVYGKMQSLTGLDLEDVKHSFDVNALGPIRVTRALLRNVLSSQTKRVVHITSGMGSIADNTSGGAYGYRMSKAALNMANKSMSIDYGREGLVAIVMNPGWVRTDMGGQGAPLAVDVAVKHMLETIDALRPSDNGKFLNYKRGETYPF